MLSNPSVRKIVIRVVFASFVLTLLIAFPYIVKRVRQTDGEKKSGSKVIRYGTKKFAWNAGRAENTETGEVSTKQLKPSFGNLPNELFPGNRPFSLDFHKLPLDYMVPQQPEVIRSALVRIKQLQVAELAAIEAQQAVAQVYDKSRRKAGATNE